MGNQQILLLVVGFVAVTLMVFAGYSIFQDYAISSNRDQIINTLNLLSEMSLVHYKKPIESGGGGGEFTGWTIPPEFETTTSGTFRANVRNDRIKFFAKGIEIGEDGEDKVTVHATVSSTATIINIRN